MIGSNAAPHRLRSKFGPSRPLPVLAVRVAGLDAAHSAYITTYGSIPATPVPSPGAVLHTHLIMLSDHMLREMNCTEKGYYLATLTRPETVTMASGVPMPPTDVLAYVWAGGLLRAPGGAVRVQEVLPAEGRTYSVWDQAHALEYVRGLVGSDLAAANLNEFVRANVADPLRRERVNAVLRDKWPTREDDVLQHVFQLSKVL